MKDTTTSGSANLPTTTTSRIDAAYRRAVLPKDIPPEVADNLLDAALADRDLAETIASVQIRTGFRVDRLTAGHLAEPRLLVRRLHLKRVRCDRQNW
jgi:hypothetical protein